jgi:hypothetical protein
MNIVSEDIIEGTWERLSELSIEELDLLVMRLADEQPEIFEYLTTVPENFTDNDNSFVLFMGLLIWLTLGQSGSPLPIVSSELLEETETWNFNTIKEMAELMLESEEEAMLQAEKYYANHHQDDLFAYIAAILSPDAEDELMNEEGLALTDENRPPIFLMLKTTLDCLDA